MNFLLSDDVEAVSLRKRYIKFNIIIRVVFKIVPMLNVDGVVAGNYRTGLQGKDMNRVFGVKNQEHYQEV